MDTAHLTDTLHRLRIDEAAEYFWMTTDPFVDDETLDLRVSCL